MCRGSSFERSLYTPLVKTVFNYRHPYLQGTPKWKDIRTYFHTPYFMRPDSTLGDYQIFVQSYSQHSL